MKKRSLCILLALMLVLSLLPFGASAADTVRVIVQNETFLEPFNDVAPKWTGVLLDTEVQYVKDMTMQGALEAAAEAEEITLDMTESSYGAYLSGVNGLMDSDYHSVDETKAADDPTRFSTLGGWMATLNDWFTDTGMSTTKVEPGDTVCVQYSTAWGADIGGDWSSTDGRLSSLGFSVGALYPSFDPDVTRYALVMPQGVDSVTVTPSAVNKNNKVTVLAANTEEEARWGARSVFVGDSDISVSVANGETYYIYVTSDSSFHACNTFTDLKNDWSRTGICWAVENGIMNGTGKQSFQPDGTASRAQLATVLYRLSGSEETPKSAGFKDVAAGSWYANGVNWAAANKVVTGYEDNTFRPDQAVTRQEAAAMLYRYCVKEKVEITETLAAFKDAANLQSWAKDALCWAVQNGILNGTGDGMLAPTGTATRAQLAAILYRTFDVPTDDVQKAMAYMRNQVTAPECGDEWVVMDFARAQAWTPVGFADYYGKVEALAKSTKGGMDAKYPTDLARYTLALTALGYDATNVAGYDLTNILQDVDALKAQGTNGLVFALLALDSGSYPSEVRPEIIDGILAAQKDDGGFTYDPKYDSDPDLTSMAIQALAPYMGQQKVKDAVAGALACLSKMQQSDGGFTAWGESSCESAAQAIIALNAAGVPLTSEDFTKDGHTLMDNLMSFQQADGGFAHKQGDASSAYTTEQALRALVDTYLVIHEGTTIYHVR